MRTNKKDYSEYLEDLLEKYYYVINSNDHIVCIEEFDIAIYKKDANKYIYYSLQEFNANFDVSIYADKLLDAYIGMDETKTNKYSKAYYYCSLCKKIAVVYCYLTLNGEKIPPLNDNIDEISEKYADKILDAISQNDSKEPIAEIIEQSRKDLDTLKKQQNNKYMNGENTYNYSFDEVNNPYHYTCGSIECIDAMIESQGTESVAEFCINNAFKYIWRHKHKNRIADICKAKWYINKYIELMNEDDK